jgi:hypothetical protein
MPFFTRIIRRFNNNNILRYSHERYYQEAYYLSQQERCIKTFLGEQKVFDTTQKTIINLLGDEKYVDTASWEINIFAKEKLLNTSNIVYNNEILRIMLYKNNYLNFIVNRCYNMSCDNVLYLNHDIINNNMNNTWKSYNLYVMPHATNRFITCNFIQNCKNSEFIIYPLAASEENKRRDINILICND